MPDAARTRRGWWRALRRDPARVSDALIALAFVAVLIAPWHSTPRLCAYLLAVLTLCRPALWRAPCATPLAWLGAALLGYLLLTMGWSADVEPARAVRFGIRAVVLACFVVAFADCVRRGAARQRVGVWFAVAGGGAALFAIADFLLHPPEMGRLLGPGQIRNELIAGQAFAAGALIAVDGALRPPATRTRAWTLLLAASAAAMIAAVALTGARTAWLALALGVGVLLGIHHRAHRPQAHLWPYAAAVTAVLVAVCATLIWHDGAREWLLPRGASFRPLIWATSFAHTASAAPWFGNGLLTDDTVVAAGVAFLHPHSVYLSLFHQGGLVGLALFTALIGATAVALFRQRAQPSAPPALALLAAGAVVALFDGHQLIHKVGVVWWLFWLPVATAIGIAGVNARMRKCKKAATCPRTS